MKYEVWKNEIDKERERDRRLEEADTHMHSYHHNIANDFHTLSFHDNTFR